jgi:hypothetical protein
VFENKKNMTTTSITFFNGFDAKKMTTIVVAFFGGFGAQKVTTAMSSPISMVMVM